MMTAIPDQPGPRLGSIKLTEYGSTLVKDLSNDDLRFLVGRYSRVVAPSIDPASGLLRLTASSWIGVIKLPSGREIRIATKVPVANVFYMVAVTNRWPFHPQEVASYSPDATILSVVARYFRDQLFALDGAGLYRAYTDHADNLASIRGRIDFRTDLRANLLERQRTACIFSELTRDIPENQVLRQTAALLAQCGLVEELAGDFRRIDHWWNDIRSTRHEPETALGFTYHRLNEHYRPAHELAAVLMRWLSPSGSEGDRRFPAFLANMNDLYEAFIRAVLADELSDVRVTKPSAIPLDEERRVRFQPDLLFAGDTGPLLVGDCKYKRIGPGAWTEHDVYQMAAYCTALGLDTGIQIFPRHLADVDGQLVIRGSGTKVRRITVDLGVPAAEMPAERARLREQILSTLGTA